MKLLRSLFILLGLAVLNGCDRDPQGTYLVEQIPLDQCGLDLPLGAVVTPGHGYGSRSDYFLDIPALGIEPALCEYVEDSRYLCEPYAHDGVVDTAAWTKDRQHRIIGVALEREFADGERCQAAFIARPELKMEEISEEGLESAATFSLLLLGPPGAVVWVGVMLSNASGALAAVSVD